MSERKARQVERVERLLDVLDESPQLTAEEAHRAVGGGGESEVAENSLRRVEGIILSRVEVFRSVKRTLSGSDEDKEGRDLVIQLVRKASLPDFRHFSIEVKSSPRGVDEFRHNKTDGTIIRVRRDRVDALGLETAIEEYLNEKKIIDLDASREDLEKELIRRFGLLRQYWKNKNNLKKKRERRHK